jgi:hypothetical protein
MRSDQRIKNVLVGNDIERPRRETNFIRECTEFLPVEGALRSLR